MNEILTDREIAIVDACKQLDGLLFQYEGDLYYKISDESATDYEKREYIRIRGLRGAISYYLREDDGK